MDDTMEIIGQMVEKADNLLAATKIPVSDAIHVVGLSGGLEEIRNTLKQLYIRNTGENPWEENI